MRRPEPHEIRSFLAVLLPEAVRERLAAVVDALRRPAPRVAWVRAENLHVTLRFLGSVDEPTLGRVREALEAVTSATAPFGIALGGLGGFPSSERPRVVWAGLTAGGEALGELHAQLERALARHGIPPEGRAFHPHVTLGRARDPRGAPELAGLLAGQGDAFGEVAVEAVHLMRSDLDPRGARYSMLARGALRSAASPPIERAR